MRLVCNEGVDAVVGIHEPRNDPEAKLLLSEGVEHLLDRMERVSPLAPLGRIRTSVSVRYGFEKYAYRLRASLAIAPAAMSAVPAESAARWSSQAISGSRISTLMIRPSARSISTSKPVRIGTSRL
jgi:hypothetical protein